MELEIRRGVLESYPYTPPSDPRSRSLTRSRPVRLIIRPDHLNVTPGVAREIQTSRLTYDCPQYTPSIRYLRALQAEIRTAAWRFRRPILLVPYLRRQLCRAILLVASSIRVHPEIQGRIGEGVEQCQIVQTRRVGVGAGIAWGNGGRSTVGYEIGTTAFDAHVWQCQFDGAREARGRADV